MSGIKHSLKGKKFERKIVNLFKSNGIEADRMYGSDGTHVGLSKNVDIVVDIKDDQLAFQLKHLKETPKYLTLFEGTDGTIIKENLKEPMIILKLTDFITIIKGTNNGKK